MAERPMKLPKINKNNDFVIKLIDIVLQIENIINNCIYLLYFLFVKQYLL